MSATIIWLPEAVQDLQRLRDFIKSENPLAAKRAAERIIDGVSLLQLSPEAGMPVENLTGYRDLILPFGSGEYIIRYRLETSTHVIIVRVRHSREIRF